MMHTKSPCFFGVPDQDGVYEVSFEITNKCNLHCVHCMNKSENKADTNVGLSWEAMSALIDEMHANNVAEIYLSGGEPTMYPYFEELVKKTKTLGMDTLVATNAYEIEEHLDTLKKYVDVVFVSIDGTPDKHNFFRGTPMAYEKSLGNIKRMIAMDIPVRISTVVSKNNIGDLEDIIKEISSFGVFQVHFTVLVNVGRAESADMSIETADYLELTKTIEDLRQKYERNGFIITTRRNGKLTAQTEPCYGGRRMAHITASGVVAPCSYAAKCGLADQYSIQWQPGNFAACLKHIQKFQDLCSERQAHFGHASCAALAAIAAKSVSALVPDPLDLIFED